jgi:diguanylate cyclase (GGDEF)-like protein
MSETAANTSLQKTIDDLAAESGLAVVVADESGRALAAANNNSICAVLFSSTEFAPKCAEYCGRALVMAKAAGGSASYECHAGLECRAVAANAGGRQLVTIVGRTFNKSKNYREATARAIEGDWRQFASRELFSNVILSGSPAQLDKLQKQIGEIDQTLFAEISPMVVVKDELPIEATADTTENVVPLTNETNLDIFEISSSNLMPRPSRAKAPSAPDPFETSMMNFNLDLTSAAQQRELADREAWRSLVGSLLQVSYRRACRRILEFMAKHYGVESSIWLQPDGQEFEIAAAFGEFADRPVRIGLSPDDKRVRVAVNDDSPIILKERQLEKTEDRRIIQLFPVVIGGELRNALGIAGAGTDSELSTRIVKFCRYVASRLEILRLREEVAEQERITKVLREFNDHLKNVDAENFWQELTAISAELVGAERASLLVPDSEAVGLSAKSSIGARADLSHAGGIGERVARAILDKGKPVLVTDTARVALPPAPKERKYKTKSFISYPVMLGDRGVGVINFTDKIGGEMFNRRDIEILDSIAPQIAVAIDRSALRDKAGEYAQLSITDALTGLLNRRYLEERFTEEIKRSNRTGDAISFVMLDVDEFKSYNDKFGHPAGDEALRIVGRVLKDTLRGADVPARYGGEEFAILLPQTNADEAETIAERIRRNVELTEFPKRKVTISVGIATRTAVLNNVPDLIDAADRALYQAKRLGRNQVRTFDPELDAGEKIH